MNYHNVGDLRYKKNEALLPGAQIISGFPDVIDTDIDPESDEFLILACDGIWDCLDNQEAVDIVHRLLFEENMSCADAARKIILECIAEDALKARGIGTDNMTLMIIQFCPAHSKLELKV